MKPIIVQNIVISVMAFLIICGSFIIWNLNLENTKTWLFLTIVGLGGLTGIFLIVYPKFKKRAIFADRQYLTMDEIYSRYYLDSGLSKDVVLKLWGNVAELLQLPKGKLRPTDKFGKELGPYQVIDDDINELQAFTLRQLKEVGVSVDFSTIKTLDDYIRCLVRYSFRQ
ncbi:MAG: hypothetical protein AAB017_08915 [Nitrospirota bacterium]